MKLIESKKEKKRKVIRLNQQLFRATVKVSPLSKIRTEMRKNLAAQPN